MNDTGRYLIKAQESLQGAESELTAGRFNNVANRGYYAAFQAAIAALMAAGIPVQRDTGNLISHQGVHNQFAGILIARRKIYAANLRSVLQNLLLERIMSISHLTWRSAEFIPLLGEPGRLKSALPILYPR